ncbi:MAG: hypothetical protein J6J17_04235 [Bacilli bacterium]|nr:hypothetical protein [Bacilli bacterium]
MPLTLEELEKNLKIIVYMGPYIKDRREGKYNDYVTYEGNPSADYKSYINLKTGDVYNIDLDKCKKFEKENFIITMPVISNSYDSYLLNYTNLKKWFLEQLKTRNEKDVIEELRQKYEKKIEVENLKKTRENLKKLESELSKIEETRDEILEKMERVYNSCNHEIVVKTKANDSDDVNYDKAICLICNQRYCNLFSFQFDKEFKNIICFDNEEFNSLSEKEKVDLAFNMFEEERKNNPDISDSKIVENINNRLKNDKDDIKGKVLTNKLDMLN